MYSYCTGIEPRISCLGVNTVIESVWLHVQVYVHTSFVNYAMAVVSISICTYLKISEHFRELSQRLYERPNCIEDLTEQREFVKTVPDLVNSNQSRIDQVHDAV